MHSAGVGLVSESRVVSPFLSGREHLLAELDWLRLVLQRHVLRLRARGLMVEDDFRGLFLSDEHIDAVLRNSDPGFNESTSLDGAILTQRELIATRLQSSQQLGIPLPLERLTQTFGLTLFERRILIACIAPEIDLGFEALFAYAQNDMNRKRPTADLLLRLFSPTAIGRIELRISLSPRGSLFRNALATFSGDAGARAANGLARALSVDEHILDFLLDQASSGEENRNPPSSPSIHLAGPGDISEQALLQPALDRRLQIFAFLESPRIPIARLLLPDDLTGPLSNLIAAPVLPSVILLNGPAGCGKRTTALALSHSMQRNLLTADLRLSITQPLSLEEYLPLLLRDAAISNANLFLAHTDSLEPERQERLIQLLESPLSGSEPVTTFLGSSVALALRATHKSTRSCFTLPAPSFQTRIRLWTNAIATTGLPAPDVDLISLSNKFVLTGGEIHSACIAAAHQAVMLNPLAATLTTQQLSACARRESNQALTRFAQKIDSINTWNDLVLPRRALQQLREICASHKYRHVVYTEWGFDQRLAMGKGIIVLFCGPSGTGKTMAAGILGVELGLDIYKIDLSTVISKYIGETEKQLGLIFHEARSSNSILFFDEADALFGKRSEVKDAHDRYANIETAYLLQKIEEHEGIVILTTNFRKNIDEAFARRMHHVVEFPLPDANQRLLIWKNLLPKNADVDPDVDFTFLARQFDFTGGSIRNVALAAAFLAAEQQTPMRMEHFVLATARELLKLGRFPSRSEFREHFDFIHSQL
jgi:SpoVK/Ycf46/Vps4 family AAA+-type ATPase